MDEDSLKTLFDVTLFLICYVHTELDEKTAFIDSDATSVFQTSKVISSHSVLALSLLWQYH